MDGRPGRLNSNLIPVLDSISFTKLSPPVRRLFLSLGDMNFASDDGGGIPGAVYLLKKESVIMSASWGSRIGGNRSCVGGVVILWASVVLCYALWG